HPILSDRRKDTAAYASLPLSTMSKSKIPRHQRRRTEPRATPAAQSARIRRPRQASHQVVVVAVDEPYLVKARTGVNSIRQEF
ncbi:hypothetical protein, partial [Microvirga arabica]|uniref:hypothetical protein n=1 Tax=Microvirga arabica TaxID=1128671 RepID=UPI001AEF32C9